MPMIDVYAAADLFPPDADRALGGALTMAVLRAEGVTTPGPFHADNTAAYIHRMNASAVQTMATAEARTVRIQIVTPPGALSRAGQQQIVREATEIVVRVSGDATLAARTWVLLTEAAEGGWGMFGTRSDSPSSRLSPRGPQAPHASTKATAPACDHRPIRTPRRRALASSAPATVTAEPITEDHRAQQRPGTSDPSGAPTLRIIAGFKLLEGTAAGRRGAGRARHGRIRLAARDRRLAR